MLAVSFLLAAFTVGKFLLQKTSLVLVGLVMFFSQLRKDKRLQHSRDSDVDVDMEVST